MLFGIDHKPLIGDNIGKPGHEGAILAREIRDARVAASAKVLIEVADKYIPTVGSKGPLN